MTFQWTPERIEELRALADSGYSASQIALKMGAPSRCSILGKVFRLRHPMLKRPGRPRLYPAGTAVAGRKAKTSRPVRFLAAGDGQCRYPLWHPNKQTPVSEKFVCGGPCGTDVYCEHHAKICFGIGTAGERRSHEVSA